MPNLRYYTEQMARIEDGRVLDEGEIKDLAVTFRTLEKRAYELRQGSSGQDVLVEAAQVMFSDVDPQSVGAVLIAARKLQG
jgi:hypothetical protein